MTLPLKSMLFLCHAIAGAAVNVWRAPVIERCLVSEAEPSRNDL